MTSKAKDRRITDLESENKRPKSQLEILRGSYTHSKCNLRGLHIVHVKKVCTKGFVPCTLDFNERRLFMREKIIQIIKEVCKGQIDIPNDIKDDENLTFDYGLDSMNYIAIISRIEDEFNIEFPEELLLINNFESVSNIMSTINIGMS